MKKKIVVFYYSRTGTTRKVARKLGQALDATVLELVDHPRTGLLGYLRSGLEAALGRLTTLKDLHDEALDADFWIVGTPVWNASLSSPVRTFLRHHQGHLPRLAFFLTEGGRGGPRVLQQMEEEARRKPLATLALLHGEVQSGREGTKLRAFVHEISQALEPHPEGPLPPSAVEVPQHPVA